ncbi:MAG: hypothetical protein EOP84_22090, partial [Verrucomicrobiaceae bacterium]
MSTDWPTPAQGLVTHLTGAGPSGDEPKVSLQPAGLEHTFSTILYQESNAQVTGAKIFSATRAGYAVLLYTVGRNTAVGSAPVSLEVVRTYLWNDSAHLVTGTTTIGEAINGTPFGHSDPEGKSGYVVNRRARIDAEGTTAAYNFAAQTGSIIPVNKDESPVEDDLVVIWSKLSAKGVGWPTRSVRYTAQWPATPEVIAIASQMGSDVEFTKNVPLHGNLVFQQERLDPVKFHQPEIYHQPDKARAGYNPNEEHGLLAPSQTSQFASVFALRNDLNNLSTTTSDPYVLLKYQDASDGFKPKFKVYQVKISHVYSRVYPGFNSQGQPISSTITFPSPTLSNFTGVAGTRVQAPYPLSLLGDAPGTSGQGIPFFLDRKNQVWAKAAGVLTSRYFYPLQPNFWYDINGDGLQDVGVAAVPWLDRFNKDVLGAPAYGTPIPVDYQISWPPVIPTLAVGDTLTTSRNGLPDIENMSSATIIYEQSSSGEFLDPSLSSVRILDYTEERKVALNGVIDGQALVVGSLNFAVERGPAGRY